MAKPPTKLSDLSPAPYNPRRISPAAGAGLRASLSTFGDIAGIVWNSRTGHLVCGHQRVAELARLHGDLSIADGRATAPDGESWAVRVVDWPLAREKAANVAANNPHVAGEFTEDVAALLAEIQAADEKLFAALALDKLGADYPLPVGEGLTDADAVPDVQAEAVSRTGDVWLLGEHRVLCGDSTNAGDVALLMAGEKAELCFTSPPYGNQRDYTTGGISDWDGLMNGVFSQLQMSDSGQVLVNLGLIHRDGEWIDYWRDWISWMKTNGWRNFGWYVWDQMGGLPGDWNGRCAPSHEFIFHFTKQAIKPRKTMESKSAGTKYSVSMRKKDGSMRRRKNITVQPYKIIDSVWRCQRQKNHNETSGHPAPFSVELVSQAIGSWPGLIYDPFLGSGSTLIAAEKHGRRCRGIEIAPVYVDVIVRRWEQLTGKAATLDSDGRTFAELSDARRPS